MVEGVSSIEVFADVWCPFAHVGLRATVRRRQALGRVESPLRIRAWPLELVNEAALDPATTALHVAELRAQVAPELFRGFDPGCFPSTSLPALALSAAAYREGDGVGEAVALALRDALFEEGRDIADPGVLSEIGSLHGVVVPDRADLGAVLADWRRGQERGVKGSPHFFCGNRDVFCPSLDISRHTDGQLVVRRNTKALDDFLDDCWGHPGG